MERRDRMTNRPPGATSRSRTGDLTLTKRSLCQLSYGGAVALGADLQTAAYSQTNFVSSRAVKVSQWLPLGYASVSGLAGRAGLYQPLWKLPR